MASSEALRHCGQCTLQRSIADTGHSMHVHIGGGSWTQCHGLVKQTEGSVWQHMAMHGSAWLVWLLGLEFGSAWFIR